MTNISKLELAELLASDPRSIMDVEWHFKRYTVAELLVLVEAYGHSDLYCADARKLFDAVCWSRRLRTNAKLRARVEANSDLGGILR